MFWTLLWALLSIRQKITKVLGGYGFLSNVLFAFHNPPDDPQIIPGLFVFLVVDDPVQNVLVAEIPNAFVLECGQTSLYGHSEPLVFVFACGFDVFHEIEANQFLPAFSRSMLSRWESLCSAKCFSRFIICALPPSSLPSNTDCRALSLVPLICQYLSVLPSFR